MIKRNRFGCLERTCDTCGAIEADPKWIQFKSSWEAAKVLGWSARAAGKDWTHHCAECSRG